MKTHENFVMFFYLQLRVALADQSGRSNQNTATLTINVLRNNNAPRFINQPYQTTISEEFISTTQSIYSVTAVDSDQVNTFGRVTYQVTGDDSAPVFFSVNPNTGSIFLRQALTDNQVTYNLRITAFDNGIPPLSNSTLVVITVNRNNFSPVFQPQTYQANVADNVALGTEIEQVIATDSDPFSPYNIVRYFLVGSSANQYFFINEETGSIYIAQSIALDPNSPTQYTLTVGAYDLGTPRRNSTQNAIVFITVARNQFGPRFINTPYIVQIEETSSINSFVTRVTVDDQDQVSPFGDVTLTLIGDDDGQTYFNFNPSSGNVTVAGLLTLDTRTFYQLRIEARDGGSPSRSATALVQINVLRNLNFPRFTQQNYNVTIDETQSLDQTIIQILATDDDLTAPHNTITYTMTDFSFNSLSAQYFTVNSATGAITLRQSLLNDNSDTRRYTFRVSITDNGFPQRTSDQTANVEINVLRNTQAPFFINTPYDRSIDYTVALGYSVFTATAVDNDDAPYNIIRYELIGDDDALTFFSIDATSGEVSLRQRIFSGSKTLYTVSLRID